MLEVKVTIEATELASAIMKLAEAIEATKGAEVAPEQKRVEPVPLTPVPVPEPVEPTPEPVKVAPVKAIPEKNYTAEQLGRAGASLMAAGKMPDLIALLGQFGVRALTELKPDNYPAFADGLIKLGAVIPAEAA